MPRIKVGEITLNVEEQGNGPAFIFIPGLVGLLSKMQDFRDGPARRQTAS